MERRGEEGGERKRRREEGKGRRACRLRNCGHQCKTRLRKILISPLNSIEINRVIKTAN